MGSGVRNGLVKSPFSNIPAEVLEQIFDRVVPPTWLFHRLGVELPHCDSLDAWALRQQKGLISVCRTWQEVGLRYLYQDAFIRRPEQMVMLYETLARKPSLGRLIRRLHLCCIADTETDVRLSTAVYHALERYCPNVAVVDIAMVASDLTVDIPIAYSYRFPAPLRRLNLIHYGNNLDHSPQYHLTFDNFLASHASTLTHLSITLESSQAHCILQRPLDFPLLRSLSTIMEVGAEEQFPYLETWNLPSLVEFTVTYTEWARPALSNTVSVKSFLQKHGKSLRYLHFKPEAATGPPAPFETYDRFDVQLLADLCPNLEHLALQPWLGIPSAHLNLRWVDVWYRDGMDVATFGDTPGATSLAQVQSSGLPNLRMIRRLAMSLRHIEDLPLKIPHGSFDLEFGRLCVRSRDGVVKRVEEPWSEDGDGEDAPDVRYEWVEGHNFSDEDDDESKASSASAGLEDQDDASSVDSDWTDRLSVELNDPGVPEDPIAQLDLVLGYEG
jgi:hypothetical protein